MLGETKYPPKDLQVQMQHEGSKQDCENAFKYLIYFIHWRTKIYFVT